MDKLEKQYKVKEYREKLKILCVLTASLSLLVLLVNITEVDAIWNWGMTLVISGYTLFGFVLVYRLCGLRKS